jgi:hypothetical protein
MTEIAITRTVFCPRCKQANRPNHGEIFLAKGRNAKDFIIHQVEKRVHVSVKGFTPHLILFVKAKDKEIYCKKVCLIHGCGVQLLQKKDGTLVPKYLHIEDMVLRIEDWNTIVLNSDFGYRLD